MGFLKVCLLPLICRPLDAKVHQMCCSFDANSDFLASSIASPFADFSLDSLKNAIALQVLCKCNANTIYFTLFFILFFLVIII